MHYVTPVAACAQHFSCMMLHCTTPSQAYGYPTVYGGQQTTSTMLSWQEPHPDNNERNQER